MPIFAREAQATQIVVCNTVIVSGQWTGRNIAWASGNRGDGYGDSDNRDRAIADYSEAIRLGPKNADALASRDRLRLYRGNAAKALADLNQAAYLLRQNAKPEATRLLRLAANDCPPSSSERLAARAELKALGAVP
ncbi:MAG: hypothetical protein WCI94_01015 [Rhodospirillales bacterium]